MTFEFFFCLLKAFPVKILRETTKNQKHIFISSKPIMENKRIKESLLIIKSLNLEKISKAKSNPGEPEIQNGK